MENVTIFHLGAWVPCSFELCMSENNMRELIDILVDECNMTVIFPTTVIKLPVPGAFKDERGRCPDPADIGLSAFTMISESHIAIHTWPEKQVFYLEISSCKPFDVDSVCKFLQVNFGSNGFSSYYSERPAPQRVSVNIGE